MKYCSRHFEAIHSVIRARGIGAYVYTDSLRMREFLVGWLRGDREIKINPLALVMIEAAAHVKIVLPPATSIDLCPLCRLENHHAKLDNEAIDYYVGVADHLIRAANG